MENASKALLIAGGILIALIIITMFIMMYNRISSIQKDQEEQTKVEQLSAFNAEYEAFDKKIMYGVDVITLINKATENNKKYSGNTDYQITITVDGVTMTSSDSLVGTDQEKTIYKCEKITYNDLGRVSSISIVTRNI